ncbi:G protein-coupled receptor [Amylocarpus encephaloides]|uniref:G protein-coupled receptor n=1 Tax=Amylocarpus encephaloides TaxID=45428 RepID=A0A9P7YRN5_9HELO|nr:G protein-coupled receptor [Amylocarpus encephaloides]
MAPFSPSTLDLIQLPFDLGTRDLNTNRSGTSTVLSVTERNVLQTLGLICSTISVTSSIVAFYWFVKMRRSFRHDLIMLLIQSDMFKALWFMIYPIVVFSSGRVSKASAFCQVDGFFVSIGVEASDFAVLQIALHTALYIFKARGSGEGGLYPYRYYAYTCWVVLPLLMASLAFINNHDSYVAEGTYCWLPVRPLWYRMALSWIPRYLIFITILLIYASIYYYVRYKFSGFTKTSKTRPTQNIDSMDSAEAPRRPPKQHTIPATPQLACHGLIDDSTQGSVNGSAHGTDPLNHSFATMDSYREGAGASGERGKEGVHRFMWASFVSRNSPLHLAALSPVVASDASSLDSPTVRPLSPPRHASTVPISSGGHLSPNSTLQTPRPSRASTSREKFARRWSPHVSGQPSVADMRSALRRGPDGSDVPTPMSRLELVNSRGQDLAHVELHRARDKIRRQLRFLFIYPLVYMLMWVVPFISHVIQYDDRFATNPPFGLVCATTVFISSQAAVDCWLFSTREKPWRHMPGHDGTFWGSFKFWSTSSGTASHHPHHGPGKTREEMNREAREAYQRRDEEMAARRVESAYLQRPETSHSGNRRDRDWWDHAVVDGGGDVVGMSPVAEEAPNPLDDYVVSEDESSSEDDVKLKVSTTQSSRSNTTGESTLPVRRSIKGERPQG